LLLFSYINRLKTPNLGYFKNKNKEKFTIKIIKTACYEIKNMVSDCLNDDFSS